MSDHRRPIIVVADDPARRSRLFIYNCSRCLDEVLYVGDVPTEAELPCPDCSLSPMWLRDKVGTPIPFAEQSLTESIERTRRGFGP